jgi:hypothetical protein
MYLSYLAIVILIWSNSKGPDPNPESSSAVVGVRIEVVNRYQVPSLPTSHNFPILVWIIVLLWISYIIPT